MRFATKILLLILGSPLGIIFFMSTYNDAMVFYYVGHRPQEYDVRVINGFTSNSSLPLIIWCSSGDNTIDLGGRALQEGDDFGWSLKTKKLYWGSTSSMFLCTMKWDGKRRKFDAFKAPRDVRRCSPLRKCSWLVREDGFYFSNDEVNWKKDFSWS